MPKLPRRTARHCRASLAVTTIFPRRVGGAPRHENLHRKRCKVPRLDNETGRYLRVPNFLRHKANNKANTTPSPPRDHIVADEYECDEMKRLRLKSVRPRRSAEVDVPRPAARLSGYTANKNGEEQHSPRTRVSVKGSVGASSRGAGARGRGIGGIIIFLYSKLTPPSRSMAAHSGVMAGVSQRLKRWKCYCLNASPTPTKTATSGKPAEWHQRQEEETETKGTKSGYLVLISDRGKTTRGAGPMPSLLVQQVE